MKTNVKYISKDFYVNPEKKTVVCKLTFDIELNSIPVYQKLLAGDMTFYDLLFDWCEDNANSWDFKIVQKPDNETLNEIFRVTVIRKAKCHGNDEFDEQFGKHLALSKTQTMAFVIATSLYDMIYNYVEDTYLAPVEDLSDGAFMAFTKCETHVNDLINKTNG